MKKTILFILIFVFLYNNELTAQEFLDEGKVSVEMGYVNKQFVTDFGAEGVFHEDLFGEEDKFLHGLQVGAFYHPILKVANHFGIGCRTGVAYEQYFASGKSMGYNKFSEGDLYIPVNGTIVFPFCHDEADISLHAGVNMNLIIYGKLSDEAWGTPAVIDYLDDYYYWTYIRNRYARMEYLNYGEDGWPKRVNFAYEFGLSFRFQKFYLRGTYSRGLTDHCFYWEGTKRYKTHERKLTVTIGFTL